MRYLSVCSGIEAASVAWAPLGWEPVAFSEIEPFPCAVLERHYPDVPNLGDLTRHRDWPDLGSIDLLVGGTPCQSFSVAGLRGGMADPRGNLALVYLALADRLRPRFLVWENVPGVLSSSGGRDFGAFLGGLAELGYGFAWRVLDAQHFGLAQRRKRVFLVAHSGGLWQRASAVLLERASLRGDPAPSREAGEDPARSLRGRPNSSHREDSDNFVAMALNAHGGSGRLDAESEALLPVVAATLRSASSSPRAHGKQNGTDRETLVPIAFNGRMDPVHGATTGALDTDGATQCVAFQESQTGCREYAEAGTLRANGPGHDPVGTRVRDGMAVRRLTPTECERLMGYPDGYTQVPFRGKPASDGPRYKALGNSMAVPVVAWIGSRIAQVDALAYAATAPGGA